MNIVQSTEKIAFFMNHATFEFNSKKNNFCLKKSFSTVTNLQF